MEVLAQIRESTRGPVVMISGHGNIETAVSAINIGASDFIEKPFTADRLILVLSAQLKRQNYAGKMKTTSASGTNDQLIGALQTLLS